MIGFLKTHKKIVCIVLGVLFLALLVGSNYVTWYSQQPKFHDVTLELGAQTVQIDQFLTEYANPSKAAFTADAAQVDLNSVGANRITLRHGNKTEVVCLHIEDTTAPQVVFNTHLEESTAYVPNAADFVASVEDADDTTVAFLEEVTVPEDYSDLAVTVVVTDASGNEVRQDCTVSFSWLREAVTVEYGNPLTKADLLLNPEQDDALVDQAEIDTINASGLGTFTISSTVGEKTQECVVTVQDTMGPELELKTVRTLLNARRELKDFVVSCEDASGVAEVRLLTELDVSAMGLQTVVIEAEDTCGNITSKETTLRVTDDLIPPGIRGLNSMNVAVGSEPDYTAGVTAVDGKDGYLEFTYDASTVNTAVPGTYEVVYSTEDLSGNPFTATRKVVVSGEAEDPTELVASIAAELSDDPEEIRDYVRKWISYSTDWGDGNPVTYGFTKWKGNCYVHAMCLKSIFDLKGIENQLIWVTNKTHYWLIIKTEDGWRHIDPTPSQLHGRYSLMTDEQRLETLSGRVWDTTQWPACE